MKCGFTKEYHDMLIGLNKFMAAMKHMGLSVYEKGFGFHNPDSMMNPEREQANTRYTVIKA